MSSSLSVICSQLQLRDSVDNKMCGEAGAVDQMSRDSRSLEMAPPQTDSLLDYGCKVNTVIFERKATYSLVSCPLCSSLLGAETAPYARIRNYS